MIIMGSGLAITHLALLPFPYRFPVRHSNLATLKFHSGSRLGCDGGAMMGCNRGEMMGCDRGEMMGCNELFKDLKKPALRRERLILG